MIIIANSPVAKETTIILYSGRSPEYHNFMIRIAEKLELLTASKVIDEYRLKFQTPGCRLFFDPFVKISMYSGNLFSMVKYFEWSTTDCISIQAFLSVAYPPDAPETESQDKLRETEDKFFGYQLKTFMKNISRCIENNDMVYLFTYQY